MSAKKIVVGLVELRLAAELSFLSSDTSNTSVRYAHIKFLPKGKDESFVHHSEVFTQGDFPILRKDLRQDIFDVYNKHFTNEVNRTLKRVRSLVTVTGDEFKTTPQAIEDYSEDLAVLRTEARKSTYMDAALDKLISIKSKKWDADELATMELKAKSYLNGVSEVMSVVYSSDYTVKIVDIPTIHNERLRSGESLFVDDETANIVLGLPDNFKVSRETILCTKNDMYILVPLDDGFSMTRIINEYDI